MKRRRLGLPVLAWVVLGGVSIGSSAPQQGNAAGDPPSPGVVTSGFCTGRTGFFKTSTKAAQIINQYFAAGAVGSEIFHVGNLATFAYTWKKTGVLVWVGKGKNAVQVDSGVDALQHAIGSGGLPGSFSISDNNNPLDMGTGGNLAAQELAVKINQAVSETFLPLFATQVTGFSGLSLVDMEGVVLDGVPLTPAQVAVLNGQASLQVRDLTDTGLGGGAVSYGLSYAQLTDLIDLLNGSFEFCAPSPFAQTHIYQPYVTSHTFAGRRPSTVSLFAYKPPYNTFEGEVVFVGRGCPSDAYLANPAGKIALIERGTCPFYDKVARAAAAGATAAIIFNNQPAGGCPSQPIPGNNNCEALVGMAPPTPTSPPLSIAAAFVQRSTGLLLKGDGSTTVTAFVQQ